MGEPWVPPPHNPGFPHQASTLRRTMVERVLLASPRGYCAGVERAVETVERALEHYGAPVYVRKQIVHNIHVVRDLEARGAIFVEEERGARRARRSSLGARRRARVHENAARRGPQRDRRDLPARHEGARRGAPLRRATGYTIVLIGHDGHEEVVGTMGEAPDAIVLVQTSPRSRRSTLPDRTRSSPTSRRRRSRSTRPSRSSPRCGAASRDPRRRRRTTSATRPPTARGPSRRCSPRSTSCS